MHLTYIWIVCHLSAKNYQNRWKFDAVLTKTSLLSFFGHGVCLRKQHAQTKLVEHNTGRCTSCTILFGSRLAFCQTAETNLIPFNGFCGLQLTVHESDRRTKCATVALARIAITFISDIFVIIGIASRHNTYYIVNMWQQ